MLTDEFSPLFFLYFKYHHECVEFYLFKVLQSIWILKLSPVWTGLLHPLNTGLLVSELFLAIWAQDTPSHLVLSLLPSTSDLHTRHLDRSFVWFTFPHCKIWKIRQVLPASYTTRKLKRNNIHSHNTEILVWSWVNHYYLGKPQARSNKELQRLFTQLPPQQMLLIRCLHSFPLWRMVLFLPPTQQSSLTFLFKHLSHVLPQGCPHHCLLWMVQLHPGAGLSGQGDQESL